MIELLKYFGSFTIITGILGYVAKKLFEKFLDSRIEKYKLDLEKANEEFKHQLQITSQKHQIQYSKLHADRAEVIKNLYVKLVKMELAMKSYTARMHWAGEPSREEKNKQAGIAADDFFDYYFPNEIFFDESICSLIMQICTKYREAWIEYTTYDNDYSDQIAAVNPQHIAQRAQAMDDAAETIYSEIPPLKAQLKTLLRNMLGVDSI